MQDSASTQTMTEGLSQKETMEIDVPKRKKIANIGIQADLTSESLESSSLCESDYDAFHDVYRRESNGRTTVKKVVEELVNTSLVPFERFIEQSENEF